MLVAPIKRDINLAKLAKIVPFSAAIYLYHLYKRSKLFRRCFWGGILLFYLISFYCDFIVPLKKIEILKSHSYVEVSFKDEKPIYSYVKKKPRNWVDLGDINKRIPQAIIVSEDWSFYHHGGIDFDQLKNALIEGPISRRPWRGASTITQQLAKNLFLSFNRSLWRKLMEALLAYQLEKNLSKKRIMEIYLNIIQYGENLYGIYPASKYYFQKPPAYLGAREGAFLAMLLPSPVRYAVSFKQKRLTPFARSRMKSVLNRMVKAKFMTREEFSGERNRKFDWE